MKADSLPTSPYGILHPLKGKSLATVVPEIAPATFQKVNSRTPDSSSLQAGMATGTDGAGSETSEKLGMKSKGVIIERSKKYMRKDCRGVTIDHGKKMQRICFRDETKGKELADVIEVESYKDYNKLAEEEVTSCACSLL